MYIPGSQAEATPSQSGGYVPGGQTQVVNAEVVVEARVPADISGETPQCVVVNEEESPKREMSEEERATNFKFLRARRDAKLKETDCVQNEPMTMEDRAAAYAYRQLLRDLPSRPDAPWPLDEIPWPPEPPFLTELLEKLRKKRSM